MQYQGVRVGRDKRGLFIQYQDNSGGRIEGNEEQVHSFLAGRGYKRVSNPGNDRICGDYVRTVPSGER